MSERRKRLLLTGGSGLLGTAVIDGWAPNWSVTAFVGRHRIVDPSVDCVPANLEAPESLRSLVIRARPDVIIHGAAWTDVDGCEADPGRARTIHRDSSAALATAAAEVDAAFVYVSTDSLFASKPGPHSEVDPIQPLSVYAKTKREGEEAALAACARTLVIRTCIIGWNAQPKASMAEWMLHELRNQRRIRAFDDVFFTPILTTTLSQALERVVAMETTGILHLAGRECISKYAFAGKLAKVFDLSPDLVVRSSIRDVALRAPRPEAPCLDSSRYAAMTGDRLETVDEALERMLLLESTGWRERVRARIEGSNA
jgi:dTDP-4-dehydrorhamnose reductase